MERIVKLALVLIVISMLVSDSPTEAWYKQVAGPYYYSVGRASGLLSGIRRSPYTRTAEPTSLKKEESGVNAVVAEVKKKNAMVKSMAVCVKDVTPTLRSCELQDDTGLFKCPAEVIVSLDPSDCAEE